jgi:3-oxoacyl-[acyl-carrier protein] reductase
MPKSVAIVTGASQGVGRATAVRLARDFSASVVVARNLQHLNETAEHVNSAGAEPLALDLDLSEAASAQTVVSRRWSASAGSTLCSI